MKPKFIFVEYPLRESVFSTIPKIEDFVSEAYSEEFSAIRIITGTSKLKVTERGNLWLSLDFFLVLFPYLREFFMEMKMEGMKDSSEKLLEAITKLKFQGEDYGRLR